MPTFLFKSAFSWSVLSSAGLLGLRHCPSLLSSLRGSQGAERELLRLKAKGELRANKLAGQRNGKTRLCGVQAMDHRDPGRLRS